MMPLIDSFTRSLPQSSCCGKTALSDPAYDHYWSEKTKENEMNYVITKQIAVEAESPEDAVAKMSNGKTISFSVVERPQQPQGPQLPPLGTGLTIGRPVLTPTPSNP
jgi:hypothetical protein